MKIVEGGVTAPKGFLVSSCAAGIKYEDHPDMALIYSETPCDYAGTFTSNVAKAAPVKYDMALLKKEARISAVVVNTGIANASCGEDGMKICDETGRKVKEALSLPDDSVLVASTGVIGQKIDIEKIKNGIDIMKGSLERGSEAALKAARAILTTDTHEKEVAVSFEIDGKEVTIGAMTKGSGMIHPNMCTMLSFITTDVDMERQLLQKALLTCVQKSFNMISVDGDTSTNDSCFLLSNGLSENKRITGENEEGYKIFLSALSVVTKFLAMSMAQDGEGATKLMECRVINAQSYDDAVTLSKSVICSNLIKAAVFGNDANWGRIMCAMGYSGVSFDPDHTDIYILSGAGPKEELSSEAQGKDYSYELPGYILVRDGVATDYSEEKATKILSGKHVIIVCDMKAGHEEARAFGCDLTYDYVKINGDYRS